MLGAAVVAGALYYKFERSIDIVFIFEWTTTQEPALLNVICSENILLFSLFIPSSTRKIREVEALFYV